MEYSATLSKSTYGFRKMDTDAYNYYLAKARRKKDKLMCMPLNKIRGKSPDEILRLSGINDEIPVPLEPILKYFGISAEPYDFSELEQHEDFKAVVAERGEVLGIIISKDDNAGIFYRKSDTPNRQRFTIAHELGHCALATGVIDELVEFRHDEISNDPTEIAVNTFAGELLIPEKALLRLYCRMPIPHASFLAKAFAVSAGVMRARLEHLKLSHV